MTVKPEATAHIVDDDEAIRDSLTFLLRSRGVRSKTWNSGEAFLAEYTNTWQGCLVLDIRMEGMSGVEVFDELLLQGSLLPVIFLTGHGDVPLAVAALKKGAFDFVEKPFNDNELVDQVIRAIELDRSRRIERENAASVEAKVALLTPREREVMELILAGKLNKVIADELDIAVRTVEVHRARIFEKMAVKSAVDLAQLLARKAIPSH